MLTVFFRYFERQKHTFIYFWFVFLFVIFTSSCKQRDKESHNNITNLDNVLKFSNVFDMYRLHAADSLKYLIPVLDSILLRDQEYRYGNIGEESFAKRFMSHLKEVRHYDSINLKKVSVILDRYGWLGYKTIGIQENKAIFLVIQHSDSATQEKYLPMLRKAVMDKKEPSRHLMLLEDRLSIKKTRYQIYGTQVFYSFIRKRYYLFPIIDLDQIIERRKLLNQSPGSFQAYLNLYHIKWDIETYKKELPEVQYLLTVSKSHAKYTEDSTSLRFIRKVEN
jgi:hypothetical protein